MENTKEPQSFADFYGFISDELNKEQTWKDQLFAQYGSEKGLFSNSKLSEQHLLHTSIHQIMNEHRTFLDVYQNNKRKRHVITLHNIRIENPTFKDTNKKLFPSIARLKNISYNLILFCDLMYVVYDDKTMEKQIEICKNVEIMQIPCPVKGEYCNLKFFGNPHGYNLGEDPLDNGFHYIVEGKEKIMVSQHDLKNDYLVIQVGINNKNYKCETHNFHQQQSIQTNTIDNLMDTDNTNSQHKHDVEIGDLLINGDEPLYTMEFRCSHEKYNKHRSTSTIKANLHYKKSKRLTVQKMLYDIIDDEEYFNKTNQLSLQLNFHLNHMKDYKIPIYLLFRLFGVEDKNKMVDMIVDYEHDSAEMISFVNRIFENDREEWTRDIVFQYLMHLYQSVKMESMDSLEISTRYYINNEIFPNIGISDDPLTHYKKCMFLAYIVRQFACVHFYKKKPVDKFEMKSKLLKPPSTIITNVIRRELTGVINNKRNLIKKDIIAERTIDLNTLFKSKLTANLMMYMKKGNWNKNQNKTEGGMVGVSQSRTHGNNPLANISEKNKVIIPGKKRTKLKAHGTEMYIYDASETPEGQKSGFVVHQTHLLRVRVKQTDDFYIFAYIHLWLKNKRKELQLGSHSLHTQLPTVLLHDKDIYNYCSQIKYGKVLNRMYTVTFNGENVAYVEATHAQSFYSYFRMLKKKCAIQYDSTVTINNFEKQITIYTTSGEFCIPAIDVQFLHKLYRLVKDTKENVHKRRWIDEKRTWLWDYTWEQFIHSGIVEYVTPPEIADQYRVLKDSVHFQEHIEQVKQQSTNKNHEKPVTHFAIHERQIFAPKMASQPFTFHNNPVRNLLSTSMVNQAITERSLNQSFIFDSNTLLSYNNEKPIVRSDFYDKMGLDIKPFGQNWITGILCYDHQGLDDAKNVKKELMERETLHYDYELSVVDSEKVNGSDHTTFGRPDPRVCKNTVTRSYSHLDKRGMPRVGTIIEKFNVLYGKILQSNTELKKLGLNNVDSDLRSMADNLERVHNHETIRMLRDNMFDHSELLKKGDESNQVQSIITDVNQQSKSSIRIKYSSHRRLIEGDKMSDRHGQKNINQKRIPTHLLPYCAQSGITPDIVFSPMGITSRMTIGKFYEMIMAMWGVHTCSFQKDFHGVSSLDKHTLCNEQNIDYILQSLSSKYGLDFQGERTMVDGRTGKTIKTKILLAPGFDYCQNHVVLNKERARDYGANNNITRQPLKGRSNNGGLRIGGLEFIAYNCFGTSAVISSASSTSSDPLNVDLYIDTQNNNQAYYGYYDETHDEKRFKKIEKGLSHSTNVVLHQKMAYHMLPILSYEEKK